MTVPRVGMGASIATFKLLEPVTVIEVKNFRSGPRRGQPREIVVQYDAWEVVSGSESDGSALYEYSRNPSGLKKSFVFGLKGRVAGRWVEKGSGGRGWTLNLGERNRYCDPAFLSLY